MTGGSPKGPADIPGAGPLRRLGQLLGIADEKLSLAEGPERIVLDCNVDSSRAEALSIERVRDLVEAYGSSLSCQLLHEDLPLLTISKDTTQDDLDRFRDEIRPPASLPAAGSAPPKPRELRIDLVLDKSELIKERLGDPAGCRVLLFLNPLALSNHLADPLPRLEGMLWPSDNGMAIVLVPDLDISIEGRSLAILGGQGFQDRLGVLLKRARPSAGRKRLDQVYKDAQENVRWTYPWLKRMTPLHLRIDEEKAKAASDEAIDIARLLACQQVNSAIMYLADMTLGTVEEPVQEPLQATFSGDQSSLTIPFSKPDDSKATLGDAAILIKLIEWAYNPKWASDRLTLVQIAVIKSLKGETQDQRTARLVEKAPEILRDVRWDWKSFAEGKMDEYVAGVRDLEEDLLKTTQAFADQISEMIKGLSDTMLAAVGVVLGTFIAALFEKEFNPAIFRAGMWLYALYVLLFPLLFKMADQWQRYSSLKEGFSDRRLRFEGRLSKERVDGIVKGLVDSAQGRFVRWYWVTAAVYVGVIILALAAAALVPGWMAGEPLPSAWELAVRAGGWVWGWIEPLGGGM
ncbi:MAG: hypothetical protein JW986_11025 [Methanotrichaceae archaeon]|nr:hypothetical protein [Methanotrichaceae archaeon]